MWKCSCECGQWLKVRGVSLTSGNTTSCGSCSKRSHERGTIFTAEYRIYLSAKGRCENPKNKDYPHYGGAGIRFLFTGYEQWRDELGPRPSPLHSVDRIGNGDYAPGKIRWSLPSQQAWHRLKCRPKTSSKYKGVTRIRGRWQAGITCDGKYEYLGTFDEEEKAGEAYDTRARELFGKFACLNFPLEGEASAHARS